ncbi:MAG: hypothetical protein AB1817_18990, partial [Chloroflexota bacterium]
MYLFVFDLTRARGAAIVAGTIFAFNPYNLGNLAQVQLLSFGGMPLAMMYLRRLLVTPDNSKFEIRNSKFAGASVLESRIVNFEFRKCFLFALFFSLQALSSFYYAFLAGLAVALCVVWFVVTHHASLFTVHCLPFTVYRSLLTRLLISAVIIAILVVPFFFPYLQVQREMGFERKVAESEPFSASLKMYAEVSPQNVLYGNLLAPRPPVMLGGYPLDNLFPGIVAVALGVVGIVAAKNRERWFYFLLLTFAFILSLGPRLFLAPNIGTDLTLPYRWLYDLFPLLRALRAPVRFDALVMFALAVLAGMGIRNSKFQIPNSIPRLRILNYELRITNLIVPLIALEYLAFPAANITPVPVWNEIPEYVRWLRAQPPGVVLELPMLASDPTKPLDLTAQYLSTYHWHATPDGYSGFNPPRRGEIAYEAQAFPSERSFSLIQALDVKYLVIHNSVPLGAHGDLEIAKGFGNTWIYSVASYQFQKQRIGARIYLPTPAVPGSDYTAFLIVNNQSPISFAIKPTDELHVEARWNEDALQRVTASFPLVTSSVSVVPIRLTAPSQVGVSHLYLRAAIDATLAWGFLSGDVEVKNGEPAHQVALPASVRLTTPLKSQYAPGES